MPPSERTTQYIASAPRDFTTGQGRLALYLDWIQQRVAEGTISKDKKYTPEERMSWLADWLRDLVAQKILNPHKRFPPYARIAPIFHLREQDVAQVIRQLRDEKVFPPRKTRKDAGEPQWTPRDRYCWEYIGHMRAMRFDQVRRLAARKSEYEIEGGPLSVSRTSEIIDRWKLKKIAVYRHVYHRQGGWVYLTRRGLRETGLEFRSEAPSDRSLEHLYWINEVRMHLEDEYGEKMRWISERSIQAEQEKRKAGQKLSHIPDGILILPGKDGKTQAIDIEVQVSKPAPGEAQEVMSDQFWTEAPNNPLRYYVNHKSRGVVQATYQKMVKEQRAMRPSIEIIDLETWQQLSPPAR
jgi:hypothetical protein